MTSSQPRQGQPAFFVAPDGWPKRTIFGNLSSFICRMWPSHLNLSSIIAPESRIEPHFSYNLLFEIQSVSWVPRTIRRQFLWKTSSKFSSAFWSTQPLAFYAEVLSASNAWFSTYNFVESTKEFTGRWRTSKSKIILPTVVSVFLILLEQKTMKFLIWIP